MAPTEPNRSYVLHLLTALFAIHALGIVALGLVKSTHPRAAIDLHLRYSEMQYVRRGVNPNDVALTLANDRAAATPHRQASVIAEIGPLTLLGLYPPSTYAILMPIALLPFEMARGVFLFINLLATGAIAMGVRLLVRESGFHQLADCFAAAAVANYGIARTMWMGQLGTLVTASLLSALILARKRRPVAAGLFYVIAAVKPTMVIPSIAAITFSRSPRWIVAAGVWTGLMATLTAMVCSWTHTSPLVWLRQFVALGTVVAGTGSWTALPRIVTAFGWDDSTASFAGMAALAISSVAIATVGLRSRRPWQEVLVLTSAAGAVAARLSLYHMAVDDVIVAVVFAATPLAVGRCSSESVLLLAGVLWTTVAFPIGMLGDISTSVGRAWILGYEGWRALVWLGFACGCMYRLLQPLNPSRQNASVSKQ